MRVEFSNDCAHVFVSGAEFDEYVKGLDFKKEDEFCRNKWLSERFTGNILRTDDSDYLFVIFGLGPDMTSLFLIDDAFTENYRIWCRQYLAKLN